VFLGTKCWDPSCSVGTVRVRLIARISIFDVRRLVRVRLVARFLSRRRRLSFMMRFLASRFLCLVLFYEADALSCESHEGRR
jgi:hypothetical protein